MSTAVPAGTPATVRTPAPLDVSGPFSEGPLITPLSSYENATLRDEDSSEPAGLTPEDTTEATAVLPGDTAGYTVG